MSRFKLFLAAISGLALSVAAVHAEPPSPDSAPPNPDPSAHHVDGKNLTQRGLTAIGQAASKVGDAISTGSHAFGSGMHQVTDQAALLIERAKQDIGVRYRWGGTSAQTGFDCSGFVRTVMQQTVGKLLPHHAADQAAITQKINKSELQPGDLVFFNTVRRRPYSHVGIYMGDGQFIHAPARGKRVRIDNLSAAYWQKRFGGARRVLTTGGPVPTNYSILSVEAANTPNFDSFKTATPAADILGATAATTAIAPTPPTNGATDQP